MLVKDVRTFRLTCAGLCEERKCAVVGLDVSEELAAIYKPRSVKNIKGIKQTIIYLAIPALADVFKDLFKIFDFFIEIFIHVDLKHAIAIVWAVSKDTEVGTWRVTYMTSSASVLDTTASSLCSAAKRIASTNFHASRRVAAVACRKVAVETSLALSNKDVIYSPT